MASKTSQLVAELVDRVSGPAANVRKSIETVGTAARRASQQVDQSSRTMGSAAAAARRQAATAGPGTMTVASLSRGLVVPAAAYSVARVVTASVKSYADLERQMIRIGNTSDATTAQVAAATKGIQTLSFETARPLADVAGGLEALVASGRSLPDAMNFLPSVVRAAQASGAAVDDVAKTASAIGTHLKIAANEMESAFDVLVTAGNKGEFELKDMAQYLPSLAPAAAAIGMVGKKGLTDLGAILQIIRKGTGTASEAATQLSNIFQKMESNETKKKFKEFGVDLGAAMDKGRKEGKNLVEVLEEAAWQATKGDLSKLPQLFSDAEILKGVRSIMSARGAWQELSKTIATTNAGTVNRQLIPVLADTTARIERMTQAYNGFKHSLGATIAPAVTPALESLAKTLNDLRNPQRSSAEEREDAENAAYEAEKARTTPPASPGADGGGGVLSRLFNPENFGAGKLGQREADLKAAAWTGVQRAIIERVQNENKQLAAPAQIEEFIRRQEGLANASDGRARTSSGMAAVTAREQATKARAEIERLKGELAKAKAEAEAVRAKRAAAPAEIAALKAQQLYGGFGIDGPSGSTPGTVGSGLLNFKPVQPYADVSVNIFNELLEKLRQVNSSSTETRASLETIGAPVAVAVDNAALERTLTLAREANAELRQLASNSSAAARGVEQKVRTAIRAGYNDYSEVG